MSVKATSKPAFSSLALGTAETISGFSKKFRDGSKAYYLYQGRTAPVGIIPMSITCAFGVISGPFNLRSGYEEAQLSKRIKDHEGHFFSVLKYWNAAISTTSAILMMPMQGAAMALTRMASKTLKVVFETLSVCVRTLTVVSSSIGIIINGFKIYRLLTFRTDKMEQDLKINEIEESELKSKNLEAREVILLKKERELARVTSNEVVARLKSNPGYTEMKEIVKLAEAERRKKLILSICRIGMFIINISAVIIASVATGGALPIVAAVLATVVGVGNLVIEGYLLRGELETKQAGKHDKLFIFYSTVLCFIGTSLAYFLATDLLSLAIIVAISAFWLLVNLIAYLRIRRYNNERPLV